MIPGNFAFYDTLNCCVIAIIKAEADLPVPAETAWLEASFASAGLFLPSSAAGNAIAVIVDASGPSRAGEYRPWLRNALGAASFAVLPAMEGDRDNAALLLSDARAAAGMLPDDLHDAMTVLLGEIRAIADAAVTA